MNVNLIQDISIGKNLRRLRQEAGYTQKKLAIILQTLGYHIGRDTISKIESGTHGIPIGVLVELKNLYQVSYDEFFKDL